MLIFRIKFKHKHTVDITIGTFIKTLHTILDFYLFYTTTYYTHSGNTKSYNGET